MRVFFTCFLLVALALGAPACDSAPDGGREDAGVHDPDVVHPPPPGDIADDSGAPSEDAAGGHDVQTPDAEEPRPDATVDTGGGDPDVDVPGPLRRYTYRAIGGISMGASGAFMVAREPDRFDLVGALGGYIDVTYLYHMMANQLFAGFCPMDQILLNLDHIDDWTRDDVMCGPAPTDSPWEHAVDYNNWYYSTNGGNVHRNFYLNAFIDFIVAFGNAAGYNPDSPFLANGLPADWAERSAEERCNNPVQIGYPWNLNAEYNPEGIYNLVSVCDGHTPVGCTDDEPPLCGEDHPDYWRLMGAWNPSGPHRIPIDFVLAVDYNGNGRRDYGEPIIINACERFDDVGEDGCPNEYEDGFGGCLDEPRTDGMPDPNGDDYHPIWNPTGTEGDGRYQVGEPFYDYGLDGVPAPDPSAVDYGEGNGVFDCAPHRLALEKIDPRLNILSMSEEQLERIDWWVDGGIRDVLNSAYGSLHTMGALKARGQDVRYYEGFVGMPNALSPHGDPSRFIEELAHLDLTAGSVGKNVHLAYGNPNATLHEIRVEGNGGHVGDANEIMFRSLAFFVWAGQRWPGLSREPGGRFDPRQTREKSIFTEALDSRFRFLLSLPPGYFEEENADVRYPVVYFLHGHGQEPVSGMGPAMIVLHQFMALGHLPKMIMVLPDGRCCFRDQETGLRECSCSASSVPHHRACVDPECRGAHETCEVRDIPSSRLDKECVNAAFFMNALTDRWGRTDQNHVMRYGDAFLDLMDWIDENHRTMPEALLPAP